MRFGHFFYPMKFDDSNELRRFYELKVSAGVEPDQVTLTNAEVQPGT